MSFFSRTLGYFLIASSGLVFIAACGSKNDNSTNPDPEPDPPVLEKSVARQWNEVYLDAIRNDFARPPVHARNLFHSSAAMYDAWSAYDAVSTEYLLGKQFGSVDCSFDEGLFQTDSNNDDQWLKQQRETALSFAAYRLLKHRFAKSPGWMDTSQAADDLMTDLGYDIENQSMDISEGSAAALGNYIANCYIGFGFQDGANELGDYGNLFYEAFNPPLSPQLPGNPDIVDLNRWQPLALGTFIDQSGNPITGGALEFLSPEWGEVQSFALTDNELSLKEREGNNYKVFYDPGSPPLAEGELAEQYKWGFTLVAQWSSHLDPKDGVMWDISAASIGNIGPLPERFEDYPNFYNALEGGDTSQGRPINPITNEPYEAQIVPRGDYTRVLAEFWADGPDSETPPGHWFVILNEVNDHPMLSKKFMGMGDKLNDLEWDIKAYFALGGAMHDAAIAAWSIKGYYDYIRPVSAIRSMADFGQSSDPNLPSYHPNGIPLTTGLVELVQPGEDLAGYDNQFAGKIKLRAWQGPDYVVNAETDTGDVGWILAENWWPYQRPSFVTPPFAGYVSGHSTYSRAAAEVLTLLTGDEYFPGGKSGFEIKANEFLVFEEGPSVDMTLEWATYRDASDQCSLSRIWGGIHPPADDIPGRKIGAKLGVKAFEKAERLYRGALN